MRIYAIDDWLRDFVIMDFPAMPLKTDHELKMLNTYISLMRTGSKTSTVRYEKGKIRIPAQPNLPLIETSDDDKDYRRNIGKVNIDTLTVKTFQELNDADARSDGFDSAAKLKDALTRRYGPLSLSELVSIYRIRIIG